MPFGVICHDRLERGPPLLQVPLQELQSRVMRQEKQVFSLLKALKSSSYA